MTGDIRWVQRFENYKKALATLERAVNLASERPLTELEQQGLIKGFEFTFELSWNVMKDYLSDMGITGIIGSKGAIRQAFNSGLITEGQLWMNMVDSRNLISHTYDEKTAAILGADITGKYITEFENFSRKMSEFAAGIE
ncbi:nucleotidyltransferase [Spirochaetia bacterium]|nr:nucleotidyltransferase [Spirochaetia bacterium]